MDSILMDKIIKDMVSNNFVNGWYEDIKEENELKCAKNPNLSSDVNDDDIGVSSDGIKYSKSAVMEYLTAKGYQISQANIDLSAKMLSESDSGFSYTTIKRDFHHDLEKAGYDDLIGYINYKILEEVSKLKEEIVRNNIKEYAVEVIYDNSSGGCNIKELTRVIDRYSKEGWQVKLAFTNEVGKNSTAVSTSVGTFGTNSSMDQTIIIFERSKFFKLDK